MINMEFGLQDLFQHQQKFSLKTYNVQTPSWCWSKTRHQKRADFDVIASARSFTFIDIRTELGLIVHYCTGFLRELKDLFVDDRVG